MIHLIIFHLESIKMHHLFLQQVFGNISISPDSYPEVDAEFEITRHNNFQSFFWSLMLLFRQVTKEIKIQIFHRGIRLYSYWSA